MVKNNTLHIRVNEEVKDRAEKTLDILGVSISEAVNMFLHQIYLVGGLPFNVKIPLAPAGLIVSSKDDLYAKLDAGNAQISKGKVVDADKVLRQVKDEYGLQG